MKTFTLPGTLASLKAIRDHVMAAAESAGIESKPAYRLALAIDEIATNVIMHAYEEAGRTGDIHLLVDIDDQHVRIVLEDYGEPFDPHTLDDPDHLGSTLEERPIGGLGVYLAMRGVDSFEYEHAEGKNRNIFIMHRPGEAN